MKDATGLKGLGDLRTSITTHLPSKPRTEGEEFLRLYLAGKEKTRLEKLTQTWEKQKRRVQERYTSVSHSIAEMEKKAGLATGSVAGPSAGNGQAPEPEYTRRQWKTMSLDY